MSTEPIASGVTLTRFEDGIPFGTKLAGLAEQRRDEPAVTIVTLDGSAQALTFGELDARATSGVEHWPLTAPRRVPLRAGNSELQHLVLATLGAGRSVRFPSPCIGICPNGSATGVREVIDPAVVVDEESRWELAASADGESESPLPEAVSPTANGICSSGSTGVPKVILTGAVVWTDQHGEPFLSNWTPVVQPQTSWSPRR